MLLMVIEDPCDVDAVGARFGERGRMLPEGVGYVASWAELDGRRWYQLMEAPSRQAVEEWSDLWSDLVAFEIHAVVTSEAFWSAR